MIPKDPVMLLSYLNTQLRDFYPSLDELCKSMNLNKEEILQKMQSIQYIYMKKVKINLYDTACIMQHCTFDFYDIACSTDATIL